MLYLSGMGETAAQPAPGKKIHPLSTLAESIRMQLDKAYPAEYWITAEVNKLQYYPHSGHCYPTLVEKRQGQVVAEMRAFIHRTRYRDMEVRFTAATGHGLRDGMQLLFRCKVSYHALYGLTLVITDAEPSYTLGEMARMRQEALQKLLSEGITDYNKKLQLPLLIKRLAIVSVETSKGLRDFRTVLESHPYGLLVHTTLYPALLQGDAAVGSILGALDAIHRDAHRYDAVAIIRGGGGEVGLDCYDNYNLAKAVCLFPLPVLTGIGHATNLTLVEQMAHRNLITPTDLGRYITSAADAFAERLQRARSTLARLQQATLPLMHNRLLQWQSRLVQHSRSYLQERMNIRSAAARALTAAVRTHLDVAQLQLSRRYPLLIAQHTHRYTASQRALLTKLQAVLKQHSQEQLQSERHRLHVLHTKVLLLDPAHTLRRGFSISTLGGKAITRAADLRRGDEMYTHFADGGAFSTIVHTDHEP
jgi:exodeoxyribonuclease VII large subunit